MAGAQWALTLPDGVIALPGRLTLSYQKRQSISAVRKRAQRIQSLPCCAAAYFSHNLPKPLGSQQAITTGSNGMLPRIIAAVGACFFGNGCSLGSYGDSGVTTSRYFNEEHYDTGTFQCLRQWRPVPCMAGASMQSTADAGHRAGPAVTLVASNALGAGRRRRDRSRSRRKHTGGRRRRRRSNTSSSASTSEEQQPPEAEAPAPGPSSSGCRVNSNLEEELAREAPTVPAAQEIIDVASEPETRRPRPTRCPRRARNRAILNSSDDVIGYEPLPPSPGHAPEEVERESSPEWFPPQPSSDLPMYEARDMRQEVAYRGTPMPGSRPVAWRVGQDYARMQIDVQGLEPITSLMLRVAHEDLPLSPAALEEMVFQQHPHLRRRAARFGLVTFHTSSYGTFRRPDEPLLSPWGWRSEVRCELLATPTYGATTPADDVNHAFQLLRKHSQLSLLADPKVMRTVLAAQPKTSRRIVEAGSKAAMHDLFVSAMKRAGLQGSLNAR